MELFRELDRHKIPQHIAVIMDGNGRWARQQGKIRMMGHEYGVKSVRQTVETCARLDVKYLTLYAFSTENWNRPKLEVDTLMKILVNSLRKELPTLTKNNIKLNAIGALDTLPKKAHQKLQEVIETTSKNTGLVLTLALSYGSREELKNAIKAIATKVKNDTIGLEDIDDRLIKTHLYTHDLPDVDLLIRTSGEHRISNFLLWQIAYAELYFIDVFWPDFREGHLVEALLNYQNRERRFGKTSEQLS